MKFRTWSTVSTVSNIPDRIKHKGARFHHKETVDPSHTFTLRIMCSRACLEQNRVSTMTLTSRYVGDDTFDRDLASWILNVPTKLVEGPELVLPLNRDLSVKKHTRRNTVEQVPTQALWQGRTVMRCIRLQPHRGRQGCGEVVLGNFRNCVTFRGGNRVAKVFKSGSVQACGFVSVAEFHDFMSIVLPLIGPAGELDESATRVHLAISDARLSVSAEPIHLRTFARACASRIAANEIVNFDPASVSGVSIKLAHPCDAKRQVSVVVRSRGSVKVYYGKPGLDCEGELIGIWARVCDVVGANCA